MDPIKPTELVTLTEEEKQKLDSLYETDWFKQRPPAVRELMKKYPQWNFYQRKGSSLPVRIWGVMELEGSGELRFHACTCHLHWINEVIGGVGEDAIEPVEQWTEQHLKWIQSLPKNSQEAFLHPMGYMQFIPKG